MSFQRCVPTSYVLVWSVVVESEIVEMFELQMDNKWNHRKAIIKLTSAES